MPEDSRRSFLDAKGSIPAMPAALTRPLNLTDQRTAARLARAGDEPDRAYAESGARGPPRSPPGAANAGCPRSVW